MEKRLFAGCQITSEMRMHLRDSLARQNAALEPNPLMETHYESKEYLGRYLPNQPGSLADLKKLQKEINESVAAWAPSLAGRSFELKLFTHTLIA